MFSYDCNIGIAKPGEGNWLGEDEYFADNDEIAVRDDIVDDSTFNLFVAGSTMT